MKHKKKKLKHALTSYYRRKMNALDIANWVEEHKNELMKPDDEGNTLLVIQQDPKNQNKEIWYLRFEKDNS